MTGLNPVEVRIPVSPCPEAGAGGLSLSGIGKRYGSDWVVQDADLEIPKGSFTCFVGPSGCGKTTLLRILAGLSPLDAGRISWLGQDITDRPSEKRNIGMVFQSAALFPHLSVGRNIGYGMKLRRKSSEEIEARVAELLDWVKLPGLQDRAVGTLSGGQRQRVAIARALATEPDLFLLDEPFSALDAPLREGLQVEIAALQRRLGITTILVTHDRQEALSLADHLVVMDRGNIQQAGPPEELYRKPANRFVAQFLGGANLLSARVENGGVICGGQPWGVESEHLRDLAEGASVIIALRPEQAHWEAEMPPGPNAFPAEIVFLRRSGNDLQAHLNFSGGPLRVAINPKNGPTENARMGQQGWFSIAPQRFVILVGLKREIQIPTSVFIRRIGKRSVNLLQIVVNVPVDTVGLTKTCHNPIPPLIVDGGRGIDGVLGIQIRPPLAAEHQITQAGRQGGLRNEKRSFQNHVHDPAPAGGRTVDHVSCPFHNIHRLHRTEGG